MGGKCRPEHRQWFATVISCLQCPWYASVLPPYAASAAGSFQAVTPLPPQAPSEESRPSTPRYGYAVVVPGRYSSKPCVFSALCTVLAALRSVLVSKATKPSGQPGGRRSACWRRQCRDSATLHPRQTAPERQCLASPRALYHDSGSEPFRLRAVRPSVLLHRRSLPLLQGA